MNREQFLSYLDDYNSGDLTRIGSHYASDIVFENYGNRQSGPEVLAFLGWLGSVLENRITPINIVIEGQQIALEADIEALALRDLPDLPIGAMRSGERKRSRNFAFYDTQGPLIRHIRIAGWPPVDVP